MALHFGDLTASWFVLSPDAYEVRGPADLDDAAVIPVSGTRANEDWTAQPLAEEGAIRGFSPAQALAIAGCARWLELGAAGGQYS